MDEHLVREAHTHLDRLDAEGFARLFAEGGQLRLGNAPPAIGRDRIEAAFRAEFELLTHSKHELTSVFPIPWGVVTETSTAYFLRGRPEPVVIRSSSFWRSANGSFSEVNMYSDLAPLFANAQIVRVPELEGRSKRLVVHEARGTIGEFFIPSGTARLTEVSYSLSPDGHRAILETTTFAGGVESVALTAHVVAEVVRWAREGAIALVPLCANVRSVFDREPSYRDVLWCAAPV